MKHLTQVVLRSIAQGGTLPTRFHVRVVALLAMVALLVARPAGAIQYGVPDDGAHPYVGGLVFQVDDAQFVGCSGTLIAPTTLLTAAHCAPDGTYQLIGVTFDAAVVPGESTVVPATTFVANPAYVAAPSAYTAVAVVLLEVDPGVGSAVLPAWAAR